MWFVCGLSYSFDAYYVVTLGFILTSGSLWSHFLDRSGRVFQESTYETLQSYNQAADDEIKAFCDVVARYVSPDAYHTDVRQS